MPDYVFPGINQFIDAACDEQGVENEYKAAAHRGWYVTTLSNALSQVASQKALVESGQANERITDEVWDRCRAILESIRAQAAGLSAAMDDVMHGIEYEHQHPEPPPPETVKGGAGRDEVEDEDDRPLARRKR